MSGLENNTNLVKPKAGSIIGGVFFAVLALGTGFVVFLMFAFSGHGVSTDNFLVFLLPFFLAVASLYNFDHYFKFNIKKLPTRTFLTISLILLSFSFFTIILLPFMHIMLRRL